MPKNTTGMEKKINLEETYNIEDKQLLKVRPASIQSEEKDELLESMDEVETDSEILKKYLIKWYFSYYVKLNCLTSLLIILTTVFFKFTITKKW